MGASMGQTEIEVPLNRAPLRRQLVVRRYEGESSVIERLCELGLTIGTQLLIRRRAPLGGGIEVEFRGVRVGLRLREAAVLYVTACGDSNAYRSS